MRIILVVVLVLALSTIGCANAHTYTIPVPEMDENGYLEVFNTGYSYFEGFRNCRILMEKNPSLTKEETHSMHTNTSNGLEPDLGTVASDPDVIPYFSIIYSPKYEEMFGRYGLVTDSGVGGYTLDWWTVTSEESAALTGYYKVKILRWGENLWLVDPILWGLEP